MQTVRWGRDEDVEEVLARDPPQTKLLAFFEILADEELYPPGGDVTPSCEILYPDVRGSVGLRPTPSSLSIMILWPRP